MAEVVTLTTPVSPPPKLTITLEVVTFNIKQKSIDVQWRGDDGLAGSAVYPTPAPTDHPTQPTGAVLLSSVNTANNTTTSLIKRVIQRLQADGYIPAGTITGTPE